MTKRYSVSHSELHIDLYTGSYIGSYNYSEVASDAIMKTNTKQGL